MKQFFKDLFAIYHKNNQLTTHSKIMFIGTIFLCVVLGLFSSMLTTIFLSGFLMFLYELSYVFVPTRQISIKNFSFKIFDMQAWRTNLTNNDFKIYYDVEKQDFLNVCAGILTYVCFVVLISFI